MGCKPCENKKKQLQEIEHKYINIDWLTQEEVRKICEKCYYKMVKNNISRIKKQYFFDLLRNLNMTFYEIIYTGDGTTFNLFGKSLRKFKPVYLTKDELPLSVTKLRKLPGIEVKTIKQDDRPTDKEAELKGAKMQGLNCIMWIGASPKRINDHGTFVKNEPVCGLSNEAFEYLKKHRSFQVV